MPAYDAKRFSPPAPLAMVTIRTRDHTKMVSDVPMQIDSGAGWHLDPADLCGPARTPRRTTGGLSPRRFQWQHQPCESH